MIKQGDNNPFEISSAKPRRSYYVNKKNSRSFNVDVFHNKDYSNSNSLGLLVNAQFFTFWLVVLFIGIFILTTRTAYLQIVRGSYFSEVADGNRIRIIDVKAPRGVIYDRHQNLLVENISSLSLAVIPVDLPDDEFELRKVASALAKITHMDANDIFITLNEQSSYSYQPIVLAENLDHDQAIMTEILNSKYPGIVLRAASTRNYLTPEGQNSLSHVLGYTGKITEPQTEEYLANGYLLDDNIGKSGIEIFYEKELKGVNGKEQVEVDAVGDEKEILASQVPISGSNLILTIDSDLQEVAESSLQRILTSYGKTKGAVVVMDPNSGEILALVSLPAFDNNAFSRGISSDYFSKLINNPSRPLFSRAVSGEYPSGSTFKLIVGAAALEENVITTRSGFNSVGGIKVSRWFFPDWKAGGHGWTDIYKALAQSVNTFFYIIGGGYNDFTGLGVARISEYAQQFGLNQELGIDLPNEADGFLPSKEWKATVKEERWYVGDTYNLSIGQGDVLVTPLQVAAYTSVFANGGTLYKPYLVKEVLDSENNLIKEIKPEIINEGFISPENITAINQGLRQAVTSGSAVRLYELPITAAAKTGTAQWSSKSPPHAWLTTFAPYKNPRVVISVLVEEGIGGTTTAMPVAYDILNWWANNR